MASLPEHAHLFSEVSTFFRDTLVTILLFFAWIDSINKFIEKTNQHGCFISQDKAHVDCNNTELAQGGKNLTPLPESFRPLILTEEMDRAWLDMIKDFPTSGTKIKKPRKNPK